MDWRREDSVYAAATLVAAALVGYLLAGNFGLVRSPFGPSGVETPPPQVAIFAGARRSPQPTASATLSPTTSASPRPMPAATLAPDRSAPTAAIDPPASAEVSVVEGAEVTGSAGDSGAGIDRVIVVFTPDVGEPLSVAAVVTCPDETRRSCTWVAKAPEYAGSYTLTAHATDREGNVGRSAPEQLKVLNIGKLVEDITTEGAGAVVGLLGALL